MSNKKILTDWQVSALDVMRRKNRVILGDDMGLGKTLTCVSYVSQNKDGGRTAILVCPANLKQQWQDEFMNQAGLSSFICDGRMPPRSLRQRQQILSHSVIIINFEILPKWVALLKRHESSVVVVDEADRLKSQDSQAFKNVRKLILRGSDLSGWRKWKSGVILATGTPMDGRPRELWTLLHLVCPKRFQKFNEFGWKYCGPTWYRGHWKFDGASNLSELRKILSRYLIRRRIQAVLGDGLPQRRHRLIRMALSDAERQEYEALRSDFFEQMRQDPNQRMVAALNNLNTLLQRTSELKISKVIRYCKVWLRDNPHKKLCVYGHNIKFLEEVREGLDRYEAVLINGKTSKKNRDRALKCFTGKPSCRVFVGNFKAAGIGMDGLQKVCSTMIVSQLVWNPSLLNQTEARLWRMGQTEEVSIVYLLLLDTIETLVAKKVRGKQRVFEEVVDGITGTSAGKQAMEEVLDSFLSNKGRGLL